MMNRVILTIFLSASTFLSYAQETTNTETSPAETAPAETAPAEPLPNEVDEVLVIGEQPGPSMWRVYKDDHVLWILGFISPLPKNMDWRSKQVDTAVAESQEFLMPTKVKVDVSFWGKVGLLPSLIGVKNNPDGKKLQDVLPEDLYARWSVLKDKYIGNNNDIEKERPIFAASTLFKKSIEKSDMVPYDSVRWRVESIVREHKIKTTKPTIEHQLTNPRATVKKFKASTLDDTGCFEKTLSRLETDLDMMRARANAWATGNIDALRKLTYQDEKQDCESAVLNSEVVKDQGLHDMKDRLKTTWLAAAETALTNNASTFAMLPMDELLKEDGYLAALKSKGYDVEGWE